MSTPTDQVSSPLDRAIRAFEGAFGERPTHAATAPGRVNLIGDHTDYNGGLALPIALDAHAAVVGAPGVPGKLEVVAADPGERHEADLKAEAIRGASPSWFAYPGGAAGLAIEALGRTPGEIGLRLAFASSVPIGSGLSSSAAIEVATITAVEAWCGRALPPMAKAELCRRTEHEFAHTPSGLLDPIASIMGSTDAAVLIDFESLGCAPVPIPAGVAFAIIDSAEPHANADGKYARIRAACEAAARTLGVSRLSLATDVAFRAREAAMLADQRGAAAHVLGEDRRVREFVAALASGAFEEAGRLMDRSHRSMSELLGVSTPGINRLHAAASGVQGVLGCRLTGGGFGGFLVAMLDADRAEAALEGMRAAGSPILGRPASVRTVRPSAGARPIEL